MRRTFSVRRFCRFEANKADGLFQRPLNRNPRNKRGQCKEKDDYRNDVHRLQLFLAHTCLLHKASSIWSSRPIPRSKKIQIFRSSLTDFLLSAD